ncbi:Smu-2 suppressor of mec-8 and unc-52 protein [Ranunculus cassubicifolius]
MGSGKKPHKEKTIRQKEEKKEEVELPKYRDRAKERREDQNPDYEPTELGSFHAVAPPGNVDLRLADVQKISIENSKYLGGDVEHTHLVKGLDYALLQKVRSEIKKPEDGDETDGKSRASKEEKELLIRSPLAKSVYQWTVKPQTAIKVNEMFLPGRMAFLFNLEDVFSHDIPTTLHRSKDDCPVLEEAVTVSVDHTVLQNIVKIMTYLRLGSSGKVLKKKKKDKGKVPSIGNGYDDYDKQAHTQHERLPSPPPPPPPPRVEEDDIFVGEGTDYAVPSKDIVGSPISEVDMEESPRNNNRSEKQNYFNEPAYGPVPPPEFAPDWQQTDVYGPAVPSGYEQGEYYQYATDEQQQMVYPEQYLVQQQQAYEMQQLGVAPQDPHFMTQEEKDRGLSSVFKRDDERLQQLREKDAREKDPSFVSESYSECYPGYQEYNREVVGSDDEDDLSKMDMGGRAKGRLHRWDFESEEDWATYNEQKEAMPKAAFQFGVKMQDGRKTRKQNKDHKLTNELHKINKILARKREGGGGEDGDYDDDNDTQPGKKSRM